MSSVPAANKRESRSKSFLRPHGDTQIDRLRDRVDYLHDRVGSDAALQRHVESVLTQTLRQCSTGRPEEMAAILAPAIMTALRDEVRYSPKTVAHSLRPLAGPLLLELMASVSGDAIRSIGGFARWLVTPWRWFGGSSHETHLATDPNQLVVRDVLVIHRATGLLVSREPISSEQGRSVDGDFMSDAVSAIVSFVRRAYPSNEVGGPAVLSFGDRQWMVRADFDAILAFSYAGTGPTGLGQRFDQVGLWLERTWGSELRQFAGPLPIDRERALNRDLRAQMAGIGETDDIPSAPSWRQRLVRWSFASAIILAVAAIILWRVEIYKSNAVTQLAVSVVEGHPDLLGYPIDVAFDGSTEHVVLRGLMPNRHVADNIVESLTRATGYPIVRMFGILSTDRLGTDERPVAEVMAELGTDVRSLGQELSVLAGSVAESERADADWRRVQMQRLGRLAAQVAPALGGDEFGAGGELARWGAANGFVVNVDTWTVDAQSFDVVSAFASQLEEGQFVGLRLLQMGQIQDNQTIDRAIDLVRDQLVRYGIEESKIVDRQATGRAATNTDLDQLLPDTLLIGLEIVDVTRL